MIQNSRVTVATSVTPLAASDAVHGDSTPGVSAIIKNPADAAASIFVGAADVTTSTGFELEAGAAIEVSLEQGETIYGVVAASTQVVQVLKSGVPS